MCQLPLISMWVSRMRSPEKCMRSHLPRDSTDSTVRPASGVSKSMRASLGSTVSKRVTVCPHNARVRVRAVRKMVSPSGIGWLLDMAHLETKRGRDEAGLFEEAGEEMVAGRGFVDFADEQAGAAGLAADGDFGQGFGELAGEAGALGLVLRQQDADGRIAAAQEGGELSVDEDDATAGGARHAVVLAGPGQQAAVGI